MELILGFGGNLGPVRENFIRARRILDETSWIEIRASSSLYRSDAIGPPQAEYLNAAVLLALGRHPMHLLNLCREIETASGRDRGKEERWGPRPLDLDLLIGETMVFRSSDLQLPHPRFHERSFALLPAAELASGWVHPFVACRLDALAIRVSASGEGLTTRVGGSWEALAFG